MVVWLSDERKLYRNQPAGVCGQDETVKGFLWACKKLQPNCRQKAVPKSENVSVNTRDFRKNQSEVSISDKMPSHNCLCCLQSCSHL